MLTPTPEIVRLLAPFASAFTRPTFEHALRLVTGTILATGRRTVVAALRAVGRQDERHFTTYHRVLNRARWSPLSLSRLLLGLLVFTFLDPAAPLVLLVDGTLERRSGRRIAAKGRCYDAVRSRPGHVATSEGVHWLCVMLLVSVPWSRRPWALPFLSVPTLTPATSAALGKRHRTAPERTATLVRLIRRRQPAREIVLVGDSSFAVVELARTCGQQRMPLVAPCSCMPNCTIRPRRARRARPAPSRSRAGANPPWRRGRLIRPLPGSRSPCPGTAGGR